MINADNLQQVKLELESHDVSISTFSSYEQLLAQLSATINHLILQDFSKLVSLLYRLDIPEDKLRYYLQQNNGEDAGQLIATMIIERQLQKIETRQQFKRDEDIADEERW